MDLRHKLGQEIIDIGKNLVATGLVIATWGNISAFLPEEEVVIITPSGMEYFNLKVEDLVILSLEGKVIQGNRKPSSELDLHLEIYRQRKDVQAVIHTHSNFATAVAVARIDIPPLTEDMVQLLGGAIKTANYAPAGSPGLALEAVKALEDRNAVLLANHGMVGVGRDLREAMTVCTMAEKGAQLLIYGQMLGKAHTVPEEDVKKLRDFYLTQYGQQ